MQHNIEKVCEYMLKNQEKGINTIIVSCNADLYMNVLNKNNNKFDLPFMGNLGGAGVEGMIGELNSMKKTHLLVLKDGKKFQESEQILDYIKEKFKKVGEVEEYDVYATPDL